MQIDEEPFGPGRFRESIWFRLGAGEQSRQNTWEHHQHPQGKGSGA